MFDRQLPERQAPGRSQPAPPVPHGPRAYRARIRALGAFVALLPPGLLGLLAAMLRSGHGSTVRGVGGFVAAVLAAPGLLVAGAPLATSGNAYAVAVVGSALAWLTLGVVAARRATRWPAATWRDYWRELAWLVAAVWLGAIVAVVAANLFLGRALL